MTNWSAEEDAGIHSAAPDLAAPGLEGQPRVDMGALEESVPTLVDAVLLGPLVLTRNGVEAFVVLPLDVWRRVWLSGDRPPVVEACLDGRTTET